MQKSKIIIAATLTTVIVGIINSTSALIAYSLISPENKNVNQSLINRNVEGNGVVALPEPDQNQPENSGADTQKSNTSKASTGEVVEFRVEKDKLEAGQKPQPVSITTNTAGNKVYSWCSGVNPDLPDEVCQTIVNIIANPTSSNPHLGTKAIESLSLLPKNSSLTMDERSWKFLGNDSGTMIVYAYSPEYGDVKLRIYLEKQNNIWVVVDGQLA